MNITPNYGLGQPEATDEFKDFMQLFNDNMDIIDQNMSGGGSGHTIIDENGNTLPNRTKLQFTDGLEASDDNVNGKTVVSLAYFAVVGGELCQVYDDGN